MTKSKILFFLCVSFVVGILISSVFKMPQIFVWGFLFVAILLIVVRIFDFGNKHAYAQLLPMVGFCLLFLLLGVLRFQISEFNIANNKLSKLNGSGGVVLQGIISDEPDVRDATQKLKIQIPNFKSTILATTNRYPEYKYLDEVKLTGKLEEPMVFEDFNYKDYLLKDHIYSVMNFPKIEIVDKSNRGLMQTIYSGILWFKGELRQSIQNNFLPPQSSILQGIVLGDKSAISQDLKDKFKIAGLSHVVAVSGMHIAILGTIIMLVLLALGLWRQQAFWGAIVFICVYIVLVGLPSSAVRAGIMGIIYLSSQALGRQTMGARIIVLAAAIMLLANPLLLFYDVGFQLSFLAVMGLIYLEPYVKNLIKKVTKDRAKNLVSIISATLSAQIFTLPIIVYNFGSISFVSPITNLLILPIVSWIMALGFLSSITGIFSNVLGWVLSVPCWVLLTYFVKVMDFFSQPWMIKIIVNIHWAWLVISYLIIILVVRFLKNKYSQNFI